MKTFEDIYTNRQRGPFSAPAWLDKLMGYRERSIIQSRTCEAFPHHLNKDCDFYLNDECISYYCPEHGSFTISKTTIVG